jgi:hypothetical protein
MFGDLFFIWYLCTNLIIHGFTVGNKKEYYKGMLWGVNFTLLSLFGITTLSLIKEIKNN